MPTDIFEYEERYKVTAPDETRVALEATGFRLSGQESQIDHWFIPREIMTPTEQARWFDEGGWALRIREQLIAGHEQGVPAREQTAADPSATFITAKRVVRPADHSAMTNQEASLTAAGARAVLLAMGDEFSKAVHGLDRRRTDEPLRFGEVKQLIEQSERKEYITLAKQRRTFRRPGHNDVVVDLDVIPALEPTASSDPLFGGVLAYPTVSFVFAASGDSGGRQRTRDV